MLTKQFAHLITLQMYHSILRHNISTFPVATQYNRFRYFIRRPKSIDFSIINTVNSEYDQEIPMAPQGRATQPSRDTRKTN